MNFFRLLSRGLLAAALLSVPATAQLPGAQWIWTYDDAGLQWVPEQVSLGNFGTAAFSHTDLNNTRAVLLSQHDADPPTPIWWYDTNPDQGVQVASAAKADCHVAFTSTETGVLNEREWRLKKYSTGGLDWTYVAPFKTAGRCFAGVSDDGQRIVAVLGNPLTGFVELSVFGPHSAVPVAQFDLPPGVIWVGALSADGSTLALGLDETARVVDVDTGVIRFSFASQSYSNSGVALSGDGSVFATGDGAGTGRVFEWDGVTYQHVFTHSWPGGGSPRGVALSADASTFAFACSGPLYPSAVVRLDIVDLPSKTVLASEEMVSFGLWANVPTDLDVSADGERIALAISGDQPELWDEVRLYTRTSGTPFASFALPGSALSLDLSPDGKWLVVGNKDTHLDESGSGGSVRLFRIGTPDLYLTGLPRIGATPVAHFVSWPGLTAWLWFAPTPLSTPYLFPGIGLLYLDPAQATQVPLGQVPASGEATLALPIPNDPALIGASLWVQGLYTMWWTLSSDAFPIVVLP